MTKVDLSDRMNVVKGVDGDRPVNADTGAISLHWDDGELLITLCTTGMRSGQESTRSWCSEMSALHARKISLPNSPPAPLLQGHCACVKWSLNLSPFARSRRNSLRKCVGLSDMNIVGGPNAAHQSMMA